MKAATDSYREIRFDKERPGIYNLLGLYELLTRAKRAEIEAHFEGKGYAVLKKELAEVIIESLRPIQSRYREITRNTDYPDRLFDGSYFLRR
jgi:tryptophanyl-tRNA synthetase